MWELSKGLTEQSGVWLATGSVSGVTSYKNGQVVSGRNWQAQYSVDKTSGYNFWDQASYQHSDDGGKTWTKEEMVLLPTEFSSDHFPYAIRELHGGAVIIISDIPPPKMKRWSKTMFT